MKLATKKSTSLSETSNGKAVEPFFIDHAKQREFAKTSTDILDKLNIISRVWQTITKIPITSGEQFQAIFENPTAYYQSWKIEQNIAEQKPFTLAILDEGFEVEDIRERIKLPEDFDRILQLVRDAKRREIVWRNFTWIETGFQLSQYCLNRMDGKVYFHAISPLQQKRLAAARKVLEALKELEPLLIEEAKEAGIPQYKTEKAMKNLRWLGPLPYCLRLSHDGLLPYGISEVEQELCVNERWVVSGHKRWADQIGLGHLAARDRHTPKPQAPMVYLKFTRRDFDGQRRLYIVPKHQKENAYFGMGREAEVKFMDGEFILDSDSGKLIPNE